MSSEDVMRLTTKRTEFLNEHPELKDTQEKIDLELKKAGKSNLNRCTVIQRLLIEEAKKLEKINRELYNDIEELGKLARKELKIETF